MLTQTLTRYSKSCFTGIIAASLQFIVFNLLRTFHHPIIANNIATELAILTNFLMNHTFVFSERKNSRLSFIKKIILFNLFSLTSLVIQTLSLMIGIYYFGRGAWIENTFVLIGIGLGSILNFGFYSKIIWRISPTHNYNDVPRGAIREKCL